MPWMKSDIIGHVLGSDGDGELITVIAPAGSVFLHARRPKDFRQEVVFQEYQLRFDRQLWIRKSFLQEIDPEEVDEWQDDET